MALDVHKSNSTAAADGQRSAEDLKFDNFRPQSELKLVDVVGTMCFRPDRLIAKSWCGTGPFLSLLAAALGRAGWGEVNLLMVTR
eukprot:Skav204917  [mRNA]  locus=scaffold1506:182642:189879:- [translate_table: standard]